MKYTLSTIIVLLYFPVVFAQIQYIPGDSSHFQSQYNYNTYKPNIDDGTYWRKESNVYPWRLTSLYGIIIMGDIIAVNCLKETWYNEPRGKFHSINFELDMKKRKQMDKIGHTFTPYFIANSLSKAYRFSGFSAKKSIWYGSLTSWLWMLQIEITDGFFKEWGFSWGDLIGNTIGTGYAALQQFYPEHLKGIRLKISYHYSTAYHEHRYTRANSGRIDDYEGMTFWLAANFYDTMPKAWQRSYPNWLKPMGIAIGQSAKGIAGPDAYYGTREIYLSIDMDITKIPLGNLDKHSFVRFLKDELNFLKFPMPTVRITPKVTWFGFYF